MFNKNHLGFLIYVVIFLKNFWLLLIFCRCYSIIIVVVGVKIESYWFMVVWIG